MQSAKIWSKTIVVFHILLVSSVVILFISGDEEDYIMVHENFGYFVGILIIFRIFYSLTTKNEHEKISTWIHTKKDFIYFIQNFWHHKETKYHNPASSLVMIVLLSLLIVNIITGAIGLSGSENMGYFSYISNIDSNTGETFLDIHNISSNILLISKDNLIKSIFFFNKDK